MILGVMWEFQKTRYDHIFLFLRINFFPKISLSAKRISTELCGIMALCCQMDVGLNDKIQCQEKADRENFLRDFIKQKSNYENERIKKK